MTTTTTTAKMKSYLDDDPERQARMVDSVITAKEFMLAAIDNIDTRLGAGYAEAHPELIGAFMQTATLDFHARELVGGIEMLIDEVERLGQNVGLIAGPIQRLEARSGERPAEKAEDGL